MSDRQLPPVAKELIAAKKRIEDPENWCSEDLGREGRDGHRVCALLAIPDLLSKRGLEAQDALKASALSLFGTESIIGVNALGHTAVMQMYDHAIQRAITEGK